MSESDCQMPGAGSEHAWLARKAGTWDVKCTMGMGPGRPPAQFDAVDVAEMVGPFWLRGEFKADMFGMPYIGQAMLGFDQLKQRWISTWVHALDSTMTLFEGTRDEATRTLELRGEGLGPLGPGTKFRSTELEISPDHHVFTMYCLLPDGSESQVLQYRYFRRK